MPSTRDIRRRIKSVKNTAQITKAMELVAASKMKKAQDQAISGRPYADLLNQVLVNLKEQTEEGAHPLLEEREVKREIILVVTTDKGLCGGLNTNLLKLIQEEASDLTSYVTVGSKGRRFLAKLDSDLVADFSVKDPVPFAETKVISQFLTEKFLVGEVDRVRMAFTNFINTVSQEPLVETLLPISPVDLGRNPDFIGVGKESEEAPSSKGPGPAGYLFEPSSQVVLDTVVPQYVNNLVYQALLEARASEHSARMVAMKNATDNANEMVRDLNLAYNKQRQAAITAELLEITTAMKALE